MHDMHTLAREIQNRPYLLGMNIGNQIRHFRKQQGITQEELAQKIGVRQYSIARWEKGHNNPTPEKIGKIAEVLGVALGDLYGIVEKSKTVISKAPKNKRVGKMQEVFEKLPPDKQRAILSHAKALLKG